VLDGELAVPCDLKPALCRIESRWKGFAANGIFISGVDVFSFTQ